MKIVDIHPDRLYDVEFVRHAIGPEDEPLHPDTVYRMGKRGVLPPTKTGPKRGRTLWSGRTLLKHIHGED